ncbi:MAG: hypothetical protein JWP46_2837 [Modestobacter sp.]|jgi:hypothetical protein|nr:hypothetical protein [Modestobacter sp.]
MTVPTTTLRQPAADPDARAGTCPACPHPLADHDPIGLRFCRATTAGAVNRGCVCRPA